MEVRSVENCPVQQVLETGLKIADQVPIQEYVLALAPSDVGVVTEGHWQSFCKEFGLQEFLDDPSLRTTTDRILARSRIIPRVAEVIKGWDVKDLSDKLDRLNICFSPINRPEDLFSDPHVLRPGGLVNNFNADGAAFRVPALPIEWNGNNIGEGIKVPPLGGDTDSIRAELATRNETMRKRA